MDETMPESNDKAFARVTQVALHANMCDQSTSAIADALYKPFKALRKDLSKDYGGVMNHLWIDFELIEDHARLRPPLPFRFQKKVGGSKDRLTGLMTSVRENVGHYSVRPNFRELRGIPLDSVIVYVLSLIYASTSVLLEKQKKLGGFNAEQFRAEFVSTCKKHGYEIQIRKGEV